MKLTTVVLMALIVASVSFAQVMSTADTLGKGKNALFLGTAPTWVSGGDMGTANFVQVWHGFTDRIDGFCGVAVFTVPDQAQANGLCGINANLVQVKPKDDPKAPSKFSVSTFQMVATGLHARKDSSTFWWYPAVIANTNVPVGKTTLSPYVGYAVTVPVGNIENKVFTFDQPVHNVPVGLAITRGRFVFFAEYDVPVHGPKVNVAAVGMTIVLSSE